MSPRCGLLPAVTGQKGLVLVRIRVWKRAAIVLALTCIVNVTSGCGGETVKPVTADEASQQNQLTGQGEKAPATDEAARQAALTAGGDAGGAQGGNPK